MTREENKILFKELCARLAYGVKVKVECTNANGEKIEDEGVLYSIFINEFDIIYVCVNGDEYELKDIKPYLRPLTSLTDDEAKFLDSLGMKMAPFSQMVEIPFGKIPELIDFFNSIHVDYRGSFFNDDSTGLIDQGLAISTEIHNPYKDKMENGDEQLDNAFEK